MTKHVLVSAFLLCGGVLVASSQTPAPPAQPRMPDMMQQHHEMMAEMKASDARLEELVRAMNAANGEAKVSAMADVVNELVRQHLAMHRHMAMMDRMPMGPMGTPSGKSPETGK
jgi:hypothetical protein